MNTERPIKVDRAVYRIECRERWSGPAAQNALGNWHTWQEIHETLEGAMREFHRNPQLEDINGKAHNPSGTLTDFLWKLQTAIEPDQSRLYPLIDFEDRYQRVFLRRGLIFYCTAILRALEDKTDLGDPASAEHVQAGDKPDSVKTVGDGKITKPAEL